MADKTRLVNVDEIVTSAGTKIDFENLTIESGTAAAADLSILKTETAQTIDYTFNETGTSGQYMSPFIASLIFN